MRVIEINGAQLYQGDCVDVMKNIPDKSVDLIVCDPPYLIHADGGGGLLKAPPRGGFKVFSNKELVAMKNGISVEVLGEFRRVMRKINIYIFCNQKQIPFYLNYFSGCNWNLISWHKSTCAPLCGNKYLSDTEYILFFREKGVKLWGSYETKHTYYVTLPNNVDKKKYGHPTVKPLNIVENFITNSSQEGNMVLDAFMGTGTTGVAAIKNNRKFIGIEIDENYFNTSIHRIESLGDGEQLSLNL